MIRKEEEMNKLFDAMLEMANIDDLALMESPIQKRHPLVKLVVTFVYLVCVLSYNEKTITGLIPFLLIPVFLYSLSGIPVSLCFYKLRFILPIVLFVGIWNPLLNRAPAGHLGALTISVGMVSFIVLMLKSILLLMMTFLLVATTGIDKICYALKQFHLPDIFVTLILITYRYISLLLNEASTMVNAYSLRAPGEKGIKYKVWGSFLGQLLIRSMDRSNELFESMRLRGFNGSFHYANVEKIDKIDVLYGFVIISISVLFRLVNVSVLIGNLFL